MMQLIDLPREVNVLKAEVMRLLFATYSTDERTFDGKATFDALPIVLREVADVFDQIAAEG
jgi:hypothetical protein